MDWQNTLFISLNLLHIEAAKIKTYVQKHNITHVAVVVPYAQKDATLPTLGDLCQVSKVVQITTAKSAQTYPLLKKGKTTAGEVAAVLFKPDFTSDRVELDIRSVCEKGWCDGIIDLENSPKPDGLHKKRHSLTQVEAKFLQTHNIAILFSLASITHARAVPFVFNRISQLKQIAKKYSVLTRCIVLADNVTQLKKPRLNSILLDVF